MSKSKKNFITRVANTEDIPIPASPHTIVVSFFIDDRPSPDFVFRHPSYVMVLIKAYSHDNEIRPSISEANLLPSLIP